jgi:hypothetical protein
LLGAACAAMDAVRAAFERIDEDGSGTLSTAELGRALSAASGREVTSAELAQLTSSVDTDGDGELTLEEFRRAAAAFGAREARRAIGAREGRGGGGDGIGARASAVQEEVAAVLREGPGPIAAMRPQERAQLVAEERERLQREREELDLQRRERAGGGGGGGRRRSSGLWSRRQLGPLAGRRPSSAAAAVGGAGRPVGLTLGLTGVHCQNKEKISAHRNTAHEHAAMMQTQGVECMRAQEYSRAAAFFERALAERLPTCVADMACRVPGAGGGLLSRRA